MIFWFFKNYIYIQILHTHTEEYETKMTKMIKLFNAGMDTCVIFYTYSMLKIFHIYIYIIKTKLKQRIFYEAVWQIKYILFSISPIPDVNKNDSKVINRP